jgi:hypothetical protein
MYSSILALVVVIIAGLIGYFVIGRIVDNLIMRLNMSFLEVSTPSLWKGYLNISNYLLNTLKPACVTVSIFGFGALIMNIFHAGNVISIVGFIFLFLLTCHACLVGRFLLWPKIRAFMSI